MATNTQSLLMLVDDESSTLSALERVFKKDFRVASFSDAESALRALPNLDPAIVLADYGLPGSNGLNFLKDMQAQSPLTIRCLFSGQLSSEQIATALNEGLIHRFFQKPWDNEHLRLHMLECLKTHELLKMATTDPLTGLLNQKGLRDQLHMEIERARRHIRPLCLLMLDVDHLKEVNDQGGHLLGDSLISAVGDKLRLAVRNIDLIGRYGGDEFAVILPDTELAAAESIAQRIRHHITSIKLPGLLKSPTMSCGIASFLPDQPSNEDLFKRADQALYQAKNRGRDRVEVFDAQKSKP